MTQALTRQQETAENPLQDLERYLPSVDVSESDKKIEVKEG